MLSIPIGLAVACGIIGIVLVVARDGWLALFLGAAVAGDLSLLPILCVIILPAWLLVSAVPEFRIQPPAETTPTAPTAPQPRHAGDTAATS